MQCSAFMALSLDGFIADEHGAIDWLNDHPAPDNPEEDYGFAAFISEVDGMIMGRSTFDQVMGFNIWIYGDLPVTVLTHSPLGPIKPEEARVHRRAGTPEELVQGLSQQGQSHLYIDGASVVQQFLTANLLDRIILTQVPTILGKGIQLFKDPLPEEDWEVTEVNNYSNGFIQTHLSKRARLTV